MGEFREKGGNGWKMSEAQQQRGVSWQHSTPLAVLVADSGAAVENGRGCAKISARRATLSYLVPNLTLD